MKASSTRTGLRVLVVEDDPELAYALWRLLDGRGFDVRVARSGPDGVRTAAAWPPDVVLCDIGLPGQDGWGVARQLRRGPGGGARLVAFTGYGSEEDQRRSFEAGFERHLTKPVDPDALLEVLAPPDVPAGSPPLDTNFA